jgi:hypothetical protein
MCQPETKYGNPVWIRGIWHFVNITLDSEVDKVTIIFYHGNTSLDSEYRNETNYYEWEYENGNWRDVQHNNSYITSDYCEQNAELYSFYMGLDQYTQVGNWTMELSADDQPLQVEQIYVDKAVNSLGLKTTPVNIRAEPFTEDYYVSEEKFTVENDGNVPLKISVNYSSYDDIFSTLDFNEFLKPGETARFSIQLHSKSTWEPGTITITDGSASVKGDVLYIIPPKKFISLIESNSIGLSINIHVGHSDYELEFLPGNIVFQYEQTLDIYFDEVKDIYTYLSGNGNATVRITGENLKILNIFSGGTEVGYNFTVNSINTSEHPIIVRVKGMRANSTAYLRYDLEIDGEHQVFTTTINVGPSKPIDVVDTTLFIGLGLLLCITFIIVYIIYIQIKHRKK